MTDLPATGSPPAGPPTGRWPRGRATAPPLDLSSYRYDAGPEPARSYARQDNATWQALEAALGDLEGADALVWASGMAATAALLWVLAERAGGPLHVLVPPDGYYNTRVLATALARAGVRTTVVDLADLDATRAALGRPAGAAAGVAGVPERALLWAETPTNPTLRLLDLSALADLAADTGADLVVDNTLATPVLQRPLDLGALATMTSLTKAASGHSDVVLGATATRDEGLAEALRAHRTLFGAIAGPAESWLALRGLATLPLRMRAMSDTALAVARRLAEHPAVAAVHHPALGPQAALAERQMPDGCGPLLSFEVTGTGADTARRADAAVAAASVVRPGTSFGGVHSSWERRSRWPGEEAAPGLVRLSVGVEPLEVLWADLDAALLSSRDA